VPMLWPFQEGAKNKQVQSSLKEFYPGRLFWRHCVDMLRHIM
jgi:hypothetical protein